MIDRVNLILRAKNLTARQFAEEIGVQPSGMSHILCGRNNPSLEFALKVLRRYPEIDANWLLLGKGAMYGVDGTKTQRVDDISKQTVEESKSPTVEGSVSQDVEEYAADNLTYRDLIDVPENGRRLSRILFIYSDNTFEQYFPG